MESRNNLFHDVVCYLYPEMKKTVCLRRKGRGTMSITFELVSQRLDCSVQRREIGGVRGTWESLLQMPVLAWITFWEVTFFLSPAVDM